MTATNGSHWDPRPQIGQPDQDSDDVTPPQPASSVLLEIRAGAGASETEALRRARDLRSAGFELDEDYGAVPMGSGRSFVVRGRLLDDTSEQQLTDHQEVIQVWRDTPVAPF